MQNLALQLSEAKLMPIGLKACAVEIYNLNVMHLLAKANMGVCQDW